MKLFNSLLIILILASLLMISSCSHVSSFFSNPGPGYLITIKIDGLGKNSWHEIDKVLEELKYSHIQDEYTSSMQYKRAVVNEAGYSHPEVIINVFLKNQKKDNYTIIIIVNRYNGMKPEFKTEMDNVADALYDTLIKLIDKEKVYIGRTGCAP